MAMLAEGKSKTKWVLNPRGSNAMEGMHFGRKMLEKMGWQSGDGLGLNKQGVTEPLRVSYKNDVKGIGYKKNLDNEWLKVEDEFSKILQNLSGDTNQKEETSIESLEKKSEGSKARLHYRKFTRNKDLSRYSEKDLSCILGVVKSSAPSLEEENNEEDKFQDKGTIDSYFEKMTRGFSLSSDKAVENQPSTEEGTTEKRKKKRKRQEESSEPSIETHIDEEKRNASKRTKSSIDSQPIEKTAVLNVDGESSKKKKSRKNKESSKANESQENQSSKDELKTGYELEATETHHDLSPHKTVPKFSETPDVKAKITKGKSWKEKFDLSDSDSSEVMRSPIKVSKNGKTKKKKATDEINETEAVLNLPVALDATEFNSISSKHRKKKQKKRKCQLSGNNRSRNSSTESSSNSDNETKILSIGRENDTSLETMNSQICPIDTDDKRKQEIVPKEETPESNVTKHNGEKKGKRCNFSGNAGEGLSNINFQTAEVESNSSRKSKKSKRRTTEDQKTEICKESEIDFTLNRMPEVNEGIKTEGDDAGVENFHLQRKRKKEDSPSRETSKKKKKNKHHSPVKFSNTFEKVELTMHDDKFDSLTNPDGNDLIRKKHKKSKRIEAEVEAAENFDLKKVKLENDSGDDIDGSNEKKKSSQASKSVSFLLENSELTVNEKLAVDSDNYENSIKKKNKKTKKDKVQAEILEDESRDTEGSMSKIGSAGDLNSVLDPNDKRSKKGKNSKNILDTNSKNLEVSCKEENIDQHNNVCKQTHMDSSKITDKKAKLLALLAKTTKDESDDSDSDSNSVVHASSVFKGSNFEKIPGYRHVKAR